MLSTFVRRYSHVNRLLVGGNFRTSSGVLAGKFRREGGGSSRVAREWSGSCRGWLWGGNGAAGGRVHEEMGRRHQSVNQAKLEASQEEEDASIERVESVVIECARADVDKGVLSVTWRQHADNIASSQAHCSDYPFVWLRDNHADNFHGPSKQRINFHHTIDLTARPQAVTVSDMGDSVHVVWQDGCQACYDAHWLKEHCFSERARRKRRNVAAIERKLWCGDWFRSNHKLHRFHFDRVLSEPEQMYAWVREVEEFGIALLFDAPRETGQLHVLGKKLGYLKYSQYGPTFMVKSRGAEAKNLAYTPLRLPLHNDLPQLQELPYIQMLHCIRQSSEGATNLYVDGFYIANILRHQRPDLFNALTSVTVDQVDIGNDFYDYFTFAKRPTICLNEHGEVDTIAINQQSRSSFLDARPEDVNKFYEAYKTFLDMLNQEENLIKYKLQEGEIICFDNSRVLHGREKYMPREHEDRLLEGGYFDKDVFRSTLRVLQNKLGHDNNDKYI